MIGSNVPNCLIQDMNEPTVDIHAVSFIRDVGFWRLVFF